MGVYVGKWLAVAEAQDAKATSGCTWSRERAQDGWSETGAAVEFGLAASSGAHHGVPRGMSLDTPSFSTG